MKLVTVLSYLAIAPAIIRAQCTAQQRIAAGQYITNAFNEKDFAKSAALINGMPLTPTCPALVYVDGAPAIEGGFNAPTTKAFSNVVRQLFTNVITNYTDYGNGTMLYDAIVTLGVLHSVSLPAYAHILVPMEFDMSDCLISKLPAYVNVPTNVLGQPMQNPVLPDLGLSDVTEYSTLLSGLLGSGLVPGQAIPQSLLPSMLGGLVGGLTGALDGGSTGGLTSAGGLLSGLGGLL